jgi:tetratricopeptide (TPR) repeat protein
MATYADITQFLVGRRFTTAVVVIGLLGGCASGPSGSARIDETPIDLSVQFQGLSAEEIVSAGDAAFEMGDYDRAEFIYNQAVVVEDVPANWLKLAETLNRLGKTPYAGQVYQRVLQLDPDNAVAYEQLGLLYIGVRQLAIGREHLHRAIELDETRWAAHNALGVLADTERNYPLAIEHYQLALSQNVGSAKLLTNLGYSYYLSGDLDKAENLYRLVLGIDASYERAVANLGLIYARRRQYDDAVDILRRVTERPRALNDVGYVAYSNGDFDAATWLLTEAIRISPSYYEMAYENLERVERAQEKRLQVKEQSQSPGIADQYGPPAD